MRVRQAIVAGDIGTPHIIKVTSRDPEPPSYDYIKTSGRLFLDMSIHDFDMVRFLSGSEVEEVYVQGAVFVDAKIGDLGDIDTAVMTLRLENGTLGVIDNSRKAVYGYDQRVEVFGSKGNVAAFNEYPRITSGIACICRSEVTHGKTPSTYFRNAFLRRTGKMAAVRLTMAQALIRFLDH